MIWTDSTKEALKFEDLSDFWKFAMEDSDSKAKHSRKVHNHDWAGCKTWEEAKKTALYGWKEGLQAIERFQAEIIPRVTERVMRREQKHDVAGYNVDVGSFLANQPEHFLSRELNMRNYPGKIYTIVCSLSFSEHILAQTIMQRGAMICALIDAIEYAGHRTEVVCNWVAHSKRRAKRKKDDARIEVDVVIKKVGQPLDMSELIFCLGHPSMLRRILFSLSEKLGWADFAHNYGSPGEATNQGDLYIKEIYGEAVGSDVAIDWVLGELEKLGVQVTEK